ncbi:MAG TPA: hypothetical protein VK923_02935 [Euzebyales bacterium]|nr:hypothetical protein [Euzebyales bacterium]
MNRADRRRLARKVRRVAAGTDTLTRSERHQLNAVLREASATLPVHIRDQADAAVEQIAAGTRAIIDEFGFTPAHTRSPKLTRPIDRVITRMLTGDCRTCRHVTATAPQPLSVCLWDDPPVFRCRRCIPDDAALTDEEDRTCDLCRVDTAGDGIFPAFTTVGAITIAYGACHDCHDEIEEAAA